jgi:hypothetical protein
MTQPNDVQSSLDRMKIERIKVTPIELVQVAKPVALMLCSAAELIDRRQPSVQDPARHKDDRCRTASGH